MKIIIEPSSYSCRNMGDVAMLQVMVGRLRRIWPDAEIHVINRDPKLLAEQCPGVHPLPDSARALWVQARSALRPVHGYLPAVLANSLRWWERAVWEKHPAISDFVLRAKLRVKGAASSQVGDFRRLVGQADLILISGMGGINDAFLENAVNILDLLNFGFRRGIPTAALGQGIGPITNAELRRLAQGVLPRAGLIALRETRMGLPLLRELGVPESRICVTGDDAIEAAYARRQAALGRYLGLNLRIAAYSEIGPGIVGCVREVMQSLARRWAAKLVPVPISQNAGEADGESYEQLIQGADDLRWGDPHLLDTGRLIEQIGACRVVVSASYHGAVLPLSQGIPVVCLAKSAYYTAKLSGLQGQFGEEGCRIVYLDDARLATTLSGAVADAWEAADRLRPRLLAAAATQIAAGRAAYERLAGFVGHGLKAEVRGGSDEVRRAASD